MRRFFFIIIMVAIYKNSFAQVFFVRPNIDTIFYNSIDFVVDQNKSVYIFENEKYDPQKKGYKYCIKKSKIIAIFNANEPHYRISNLYSNYVFNRKIETETVESDCSFVPIDTIYKNGTFLGQALTIQFSKEVDTILFKGKHQIFQRNDTTFNLLASKASFNDKEFSISSYHGMNVSYSDKSSQDIFMIMIYEDEYLYQAYYVVVDSNGYIDLIYNFYK